jgi:hypothetical protein
MSLGCSRAGGNGSPITTAYPRPSISRRFSKLSLKAPARAGLRHRCPLCLIGDKPFLRSIELMLVPEKSRSHVLQELAIFHAARSDDNLLCDDQSEQHVEESKQPVDGLHQLVPDRVGKGIERD